MSEVRLAAWLRQTHEELESANLPGPSGPWHPGILLHGGGEAARRTRAGGQPASAAA